MNIHAYRFAPGLDACRMRDFAKRSETVGSEKRKKEKQKLAVSGVEGKGGEWHVVSLYCGSLP